MSNTPLLHSPLISVLLTIAIVAFIIYRQLRPRTVTLRGLLLFPLLILLFNIHAFSAFHPSFIKIVEILITSIVSIVFGLLACRELRMYKNDKGQVLVRGSWTYFLWWIAAFVIKSILSILFKETTITAGSQIDILIPVFLLLLIRNGYLYWKAKQRGFVLH